MESYYGLMGLFYGGVGATVALLLAAAFSRKAPRASAAALAAQRAARKAVARTRLLGCPPAVQQVGAVIPWEVRAGISEAARELEEVADRAHRACLRFQHLESIYCAWMPDDVADEVLLRLDRAVGLLDAHKAADRLDDAHELTSYGTADPSAEIAGVPEAAVRARRSLVRHD